MPESPQPVAPSVGNISVVTPCDAWSPSGNTAAAVWGDPSLEFTRFSSANKADVSWGFRTKLVSAATAKVESDLFAKAWLASAVQAYHQLHGTPCT